MDERTCAQCAVLLPPDSHWKRRFCSKQCQAQNWRARHPEKWCGYATTWRRANIDERSGQTVDRLCIICASPFVTPVLQPKTMCGLAACSRTARKLRQLAAHPPRNVRYRCLYCDATIIGYRKKPRVQCGDPACRRRWSAAKVRLRTALKRGSEAGSVRIDIGQVVRRAEGVCYLCGTGLDPLARYPEAMTTVLDHVIPVARGGPHNEAALRAVHSACNLRKSDKILSELVLPFDPPTREPLLGLPDLAC